MTRSIACTMLALLIFTLFKLCLAATGSEPDVFPYTNFHHPHLDDFKIYLDLGNGKAYNSEVYVKAISFLDDLKTAPSCHRLAASTLIVACQNVGSESSMETELAEIREEYAAKIAICELKAVSRSVKNAIPGDCTRFLPSKEACPQLPIGGFSNRMKSEKKQVSDELCYYELSNLKITSCINALHAHPQSWTSYSNALQNIQNTCQASRLTIEKDQILETFKNSVTVTEGLNDMIAKVIEQSSSFIIHQQAVQLTVKEDWQRLSEEVTDYARNILSEIFVGAKDHWSGMLELFAYQAKEVSAAFNYTVETAGLATTKIQKLHHSVEDLQLKKNAFQSDLQASHEQVSAHLERMKASGEFALVTFDAIKIVSAMILEEVLAASSAAKDSTNQQIELARDLTLTLTDASSAAIRYKEMTLISVLITCVVLLVAAVAGFAVVLLLLWSIRHGQWSLTSMAVFILFTMYYALTSIPETRYAIGVQEPLSIVHYGVGVFATLIVMSIPEEAIYYSVQWVTRKLRRLQRPAGLPITVATNKAGRPLTSVKGNGNIYSHRRIRHDTLIAPPLVPPAGDFYHGTVLFDNKTGARYPSTNTARQPVKKGRADRFSRAKSVPSDYQF